jgi:hypothetical protein
MRLTDATITYIDVEPVIPEVKRGGFVLNGKTPKARGTVYEWDDAAKRMRPYDVIAECSVTENSDGSVKISGVSMKAEKMFGASEGHVELRIVPGKGCKGCQGYQP